MRGNYIQVGGDMILREQITNIDDWGYPPNAFRYATKETNINIQKHDILLLIGRKYFYYSINNISSSEIIRRHIPALLTTYQLPGSTKTLYFPRIQVDFSGRTDEGDMFYTFMCETAHIVPTVYISTQMYTLIYYKYNIHAHTYNII